ncbi:hypothetical protein Mapa_004534 [Marchantia paleacea]|nr:hypothetical protein Mapa_004534 [Marchantia paleacea]
MITLFIDYEEIWMFRMRPFDRTKKSQHFTLVIHSVKAVTNKKNMGTSDTEL